MLKQALKKTLRHQNLHLLFTFLCEKDQRAQDPWVSHHDSESAYRAPLAQIQISIQNAGTQQSNDDLRTYLASLSAAISPMISTTKKRYMPNAIGRKSNI